MFAPRIAQCELYKSIIILHTASARNITFCVCFHARERILDTWLLLITSDTPVCGGLSTT